MKVSDVISRVRSILNDADATGYRWSDAELIDSTNDAQRLVALYRPDSCAANSVTTLAAGSKQAIPTDGFRLLDVIRNIGADGVTPGRSVRIAERDTLDAYDPYWHTNTRKGEVKNFVYDERSPKVYYVNPPVTAGVKVELLYSKYPTEVVTSGDDLTVTDAYFEAIINFVLFRCYAKDADFGANAQLANSYLSLFASTMGAKLQKDVAFGPALTRKGGDPGVAIQAGGV